MAAIDTEGGRDITPHFMSARISYTAPLTPERYHAVAERISAGKLDSLFFHPPETTGMLDGEALWYKARLPAGMLSGKRLILEVPYTLSAINLWLKTNNGIALQVQVSSSANPVFLLPEGVDRDVQLLLSVVGETPVIFKLMLWTKEAWDEYHQWQLIWHGLVLGVLAVLMLYSLFLYVSFRENSALYYLLHLVFLSLLLFDLAGLWKTYTDVVGIPLTSLALATVFGILFCNHFLKIRILSPPIWRFSIFIIGSVALMGVLNLFPAQIMTDGHLFLITLFLCGFSVTYCLAISVMALVKSIKSAHFLIPAFIIAVGVFCFYILRLLGSSFPTLPVHHVIEVAVLLEALLLSLAVIDGIRLANANRKYGGRRSISAQKMFSRQVIHMQETERERFSNTLHDSIGHGLLVLKNNLHALEKSNIDSPDICSNIKTLTEQCGNVLADVRDLSHDLHPHTLRKLGLEAAIESTVELAFSQQAIDWVVKTDIDENLLQEEQKIAVYRIIQEAVNNVLRHSEANEVILSVTCDENELSIEIKDDGKGIPDDQTIEEGIGFSTMSGRAELLGGWMKVISSATQGTILKFGIPLK